MKKKLFTIFILWLLIINLFALLSLNRYNLKTDTAYIWVEPNRFYQEQKWDLISLHAHWDSEWYLDIAKDGYSNNGNGKISNVVFFPLYPLLIKLVSFLTLGNLILAGWLVSSIFLFFALLYFFKLVKEFHPAVNPYLPIFLLLIFPTAFFLNAVYTESLFLFLSLATFYHTFKKDFWWAGFFGIFAALTRVTGCLLIIPVLWEYLKIKNFNLKHFLSKEIFHKDIIPILLIPVGTLSFFLYHYLQFGDFLLFFRAQEVYGRGFKLNPEHFIFFSSPSVVNFAIDIFFLILILVAIYFAYQKLRESYGLYMLALISTALISGTLMSIGRYILTLFPIYILGASIKNQYLRQGWVLLSILLLGMNITLFVNNYWAG